MTNEDKIHALKLIKLKIEPPTANRLGWLETWIHKEDLEAFDSAIKALDQESTTKNNLGVDCIDRRELLKAMDTWDKFGDDPNKGLIPLRTPTLQDRYVPYVKYDDMINCVKGMPSVTPQEPRKGEWLRMSDLSEQEDNRYKCSRCGNVIHHKNKMDLYTFNSWCGRCGSDNGRHINYGVAE